MISRRDMQRAALVVRTLPPNLNLQLAFAVYFSGETGYEPAYFASLCKQKTPGRTLTSGRGRNASQKRSSKSK